MRSRMACVVLAAGAVAALPSSLFGQCDPLVVKYDTGSSSHWWWGAFGNCKQHGGTTNRDAIFACAWNQVPAWERYTCLRDRLAQTERTRQAIDDVAAFNGPPDSCDQLMVKYDRTNWWWGALGNCKRPGGTTNRDAIFACAWNQVPSTDRTSCLRARLSATEFTRQGIDSVVAFNGPPNSCDQLMVKYDRSSFWDGAFRSCIRRGGPTDRDAIFECAWMRVPALDLQTCLKDRLKTTEQTRQGIDTVAAANGVIANNISEARFDTCLDRSSGCPETCDLPTDGTVPVVWPAKYFAPLMPQDLLDAPAEGQNIGANEGRLQPILRDAARLADPLNCTLPLAAIHYGRAEGGNNQRDATLGQAFADLSVTGRRAFAAFRQALPGEAYCVGLPDRALAAGCPAAVGVPDRAAVTRGCRTALDRAYAVANFLRTGQALQANPNKRGDRDALGFIAVSGEDDAPHRPVNVPSSDFPQFDLDVVVDAPRAVPPRPPSVVVSTRFVVAQSRPPALPAVQAPPGRWMLRPEPPPVIPPRSQVLIFIHGMDSRAEEAGDLISELFRRRQATDPNLVIIAMDLPTSGYASHLDYEAVSPLSEIGGPKLTYTPVPVPLPSVLYPIYSSLLLAAGIPPPPPGPTLVIPPGLPIPDFAATGRAPLLDFFESFVVRFVDALDARARIKPYVKAVLGGSLGGNMSLRLGRRPDLDWLPAVVAWSPASIWDSLGEGSDLLKHAGPLGAWLKANDRDAMDPNDLGPARQSVRRDFFGGWDEPILPGVIPAQSETWASDVWPCKRSAVATARLERHETYTPLFQSWHWRLGAEQLLYSHQSPDAQTGSRRYMANYTPMLLACGMDDEVPFNNICSATMRTAPLMTMTPGKAIFMDDTGHSLHNERRTFFAGEVERFLKLR